MTDYPTANEAITQRFTDVWEPTGFEYGFGNEKLGSREDMPWARFVLRHSLATQSTLGPVGNRRFDRSGSAFIQVFTPTQEGTRRSAELVQRVVDGFEGARISGTSICFNDVIPREVGPSGKWYQVTIEVTFIYSDIR